MRIIKNPLAKQRVIGAMAVIVIGLICCLPASAGATDYAWSGGGGSGADDWSNGANWLGGVAPSSGASIGTLTFPKLSGFVSSDNDLSGVSADQLMLDDSNGYSLGGESLTLGSGGLTVAASEGTDGSLTVAMSLALSGSQTWTMSGPVGGVPFGQNVRLGGDLTGESATLTIDLNSSTGLIFGSDLGPSTAVDEVGDVTINGMTAPEGTPRSTVSLDLPAFNASDGHRLSVHNVELESEAATGPITATESDLFLGGSANGAVTAISSVLFPDEILRLPSLSLDAASIIHPHIVVHGTTPGADYDQIVSSGVVNLGDATLEPIGVAADGGKDCPPPSVGQTDTLVSTTGSLIGRFGSLLTDGNRPNGEAMVVACLGSNGPVVRFYPYRVAYNTTSSPETVTATALPAVPVSFSEAIPTISGTATEGQTLGVSRGTWTNEPTGYSDQWQRCDSSGDNCQPIAGATAQNYSLTSADVGSTIRVQETASNSEGNSEPAVSATTAVVQAGTPSKPGGESPGDGGGTPDDGGGTGAVTNPGQIGATISSAQIKASLARQIAASGKAARIGTLLKHGGLSLNVTALEAGNVTVQWFYTPAAAKRAKVKPVLVAAGKLSFATAGTDNLALRLTAAGRKLLRHSKRISLRAKGVFVASSGAVTSVTSGLVVRR